MKQKISLPEAVAKDREALVKKGFLEMKEDQYIMTNKAKVICATLDSYFIKAKKKTDIQLMGKDFVERINNYREVFPAKNLPSGKPARNNVKALGEAFRWFFETYDYTLDQVVEATRMYVNEYRDAEYMYMQTIQYFICKQDKHRVKSSTLADYCDMIRDGIYTEQQTFKEKVV